ncbi:MAG: TldD/PmbA family protein [Bacteroidales bacterium]|jgi:predicted Zn-dependent protease|nr:TldD/PmbA family protein [Bacteroidales bacterium]
MLKDTKNIICQIIFFSLFILQAQTVPAQDKLLNILKDELKREMAGFQQNADSSDVPYFISYRVDETKSETVRTTFGSLVYSRESHNRIFTPMVRVGSYETDNYHQLRETNTGNRTAPAYLPVEDSEDAIRQCIWWTIDQTHKNAIDRFEKVKSNMAVKVQEEDRSADYTPQEAVKYYEAPLAASHTRFNRKDWEEKLKQYSATFKQSNDIIDGWASINMQTVRKYYVSSEGAEIAQNMAYITLNIGATVKAGDGMELPLHKSWFALTANHLPSDREVMRETAKITAKLQELKDAPVVEAFSGPALLSPEASGVFFHEIFGHRVEGQRMRQETDGQTFKKKAGEAVLPDFLNVYMDPTVDRYKGREINGYYKFDDEGVKGQKVPLVENGILKGFLMSRVPVEGFPASNGHGRAAPGMNPTARQSNLIIECTQGKTEKELRQALRDELKRQSKEYGYYFASVTGGFTQTGRYSPNAFNVTPNEVYRVYADGRPDELVRGVDLVGTPLAMFSQIGAAGAEGGYFIGLCGAESGSVQVSCISPMLFVRQIEIQKKVKSQSLPPLLPKPQ